MNKSKKRSIILYSFIIFAVILCWSLLLVAALYMRGSRLIIANPIIPQINIADTPYRPPLLSEAAACAAYAPQPPAVAARSAVVIDAESGALLFEKNPDQSIPPASLTKLAAIYTAMQAIENGEITLTDTLSPPSESWAVNIPPGSSLMFLGKNQKVTVEELILGMSVVSGNDAAIALAIHVAGSVSAFVTRMNKAMEELGLQNTHFEEPSGLSEHNRTTARDFARFSAVYVQKYPDHLQRFHSVRELSYPQPHNMLIPQQSIRQAATNTLLTKLDGCDGIKTGFIYESGFNIALTAVRNGQRFIAVILGGSGKNSAQGKKIREYNGTVLLEWAFSHFSTVYAQDIPISISAVPVLGAESSADTSAVLPVLGGYTANAAAFTVLKTTNESNKEAARNIRPRIILPPYLSAPITARQKIGRIQFIATVGDTKEEYIAAEFPLLADRTTEKGHELRWKYDNLAIKCYRFIHSFSE